MNLRFAASMLGLVIFILGTGIVTHPQQNTAQTELVGKGPCTNFPKRFRNLESRLAWFYGCMHEDPPTPAQIEAKISATISALPPERRKMLEGNAFKGLDSINREVTYGVAFGDLPVQIYPK
jgi:hypothetical protein